VDAINREGLEVHELEEIARSANIPTLLMVIYQVTGDKRWLERPFQPTRTKGLSDHDSGGLPERIQAEIRHAAALAFRHLQEGKSPAIAMPTPEQTSVMLGVCVGESVDDSYGQMFSEEFRRRIGASDSAGRSVSPPGDFRVLVIGPGIRHYRRAPSPGTGFPISSCRQACCAGRQLAGQPLSRRGGRYAQPPVLLFLRAE